MTNASWKSAQLAENRGGTDQRTLKSGPLIKAVVLTDIHQMSKLPLWPGTLEAELVK